MKDGERAELMWVLAAFALLFAVGLVIGASIGRAGG
jgi:hypothetical protein